MINIAICDDSEIDRTTLTNLLKKYFVRENLTINIKQYSSGENLVYEYQDDTASFDILFLDIFMKGKNGIEIAKVIRQYDKDVKIFIITSSEDFALESFQVFASGYLIKPIDAQKLFDCMDQYIYAEGTQQKKCLIIKTRNKQIKIPYKEIIYIESSNTKILVHTINEEQHFYGKLDDVENSLNDECFVRCHQSYIVNLNHVKSIDNTIITMADDSIPIRRKGIRAIREQYYKYIIESAMQ